MAMGKLTLHLIIFHQHFHSILTVTHANLFNIENSKQVDSDTESDLTMISNMNRNRQNAGKSKEDGNDKDDDDPDADFNDPEDLDFEDDDALLDQINNEEWGKY